MPWLDLEEEIAEEFGAIEADARYEAAVRFAQQRLSKYESVAQATAEARQDPARREQYVTAHRARNSRWFQNLKTDPARYRVYLDKIHDRRRKSGAYTKPERTCCLTCGVEVLQATRGGGRTKLYCARSCWRKDYNRRQREHGPDVLQQVA